MSKRYTFRKFINDVHLWLGLASGLVLFVVCLSGTIYTFSDEIQELLDPSKYKALHVAEQERMPVDTLIERVRTQHKGPLVYATIPDDPDRAYVISVRQRPADKWGTAYYVDPYSGQLQGNGDTRSAAFFLWVMNLHRWLLMRESGGMLIVGVATLIFVILSFTGLILWIPKKFKGWKRGLTIKFRSNGKRLNHDLHNTLGFYAMPLLLIMALTGLCWSFEWYSKGVSQLIGAEVWGEYYAKPLRSKPSKGRPTVSINPLLSEVKDRSNHQGVTFIRFPKDSSGVLVAEKTHNGAFTLAAVDKFTVDQYTGQVIKADRFKDRSAGEQLVSMVRPLHIGSVYGLASKILYFIACLIATSLPITGCIIFLNKLR
ncbi:PepSY domain-containing protein [Mucilaginibacter daejeonensis]|uniref:PepSY-associated TM helix domain-containing protein n=1 Tax=Mucilaginibacter daejeonensis TaxID=398049 RepID=UPI001D17973A|nr:PepSY-associated TM helix domain-containing protein [Mucilaginibacter daejeonensis]UEG54188.1 PepSY domain-containing protein [Mucilaginibacter daejeonensis]